MVVVCATSTHREIPFKLKQSPWISSYWDAKLLVLFIISNDSICNVCKSVGQTSNESNDFEIVHQRSSVYIIISSKQSDSMAPVLHRTRWSLNWIDHLYKIYGKTAPQISWIYVTNLSQFDTFPYCMARSSCSFWCCSFHGCSLYI